MRIWFQGEPGAFSEAALRRLAPEAEPVGLPTFFAVFEALDRDPEGVALLPIENAYAGTVVDVLNGLVADARLAVRLETSHRVELALMGPPGLRLEEVRRVRSHPQALMQSRGFWSARGWQMEVASDTAGSARELAEARWPGVAAIAARSAAERYGLEVLVDHIEDHDDNRTRFWLVTRAGAHPGLAEAWAGADGLPVVGWKTAVVFDAPNLPGSLMRALQPFAERGINLSKIQSLPRPHVPFAFRFWIDCEERDLSPVLPDFAARVEGYRILGSFPVVRPEPEPGA
ncbi:Prephenate dehydratase [Candidatus Hydrogenisulfobacillus filiaventi]|uniref:Prephenate dehydratase n=1 Tax=Candidatus Hydrogenisulfobacillus filiaventi TaxID=2707344 RepID=A0A6F8ZFB3_9FIRM|nr:prephenate dehydratase [Bacillota bacterium]CAB1128323.1 Prephenate dehydratase [Candidatus Hydrogenisulfobacillus filiaventi]